MKAEKIATIDALDLLVCNWTQYFENVNHRCISRLHHDENGDEFITIYDPATDRCLTVWLSPARYGNEALTEARRILSFPYNIR